MGDDRDRSICDGAPGQIAQRGRYTVHHVREAFAAGRGKNGKPGAGQVAKVGQIGGQNTLVRSVILFPQPGILMKRTFGK